MEYSQTPAPENPAQTGVAEDARRPLRLAIGSTAPLAGWKTLNVSPGPGVDYVGDCVDLSQFPDSSISEIYASHVYEHLSHNNVLRRALCEAHRVLVPGGIFRVSVPDLEVLCRMFLIPGLRIEQRYRIMEMMFGGQLDEHDFHRIGLTWEFLDYFLKETGFQKIRRVPEFGIFPNDCSGIRFLGQLISVNVEAVKG